MVNKKILTTAMICTLLSQQSFANEQQGLYLRGSHYNQFLNHSSSLKITKSAVKDNSITNFTINDRSETKTESQKISEYKPNYNPPFAASLAFGYSGDFKDNSYEVELEGAYSQIKVNNIGLIDGPMVLFYRNKSEAYGVVMNHKQIENLSVMANIYHHWKNERFSFSPYIGAGIGATRMKMFEEASIAPAYQLKAGLNHRIAEDVYINVGYKHFGVVGNNFDFKTEKAEIKEVTKGGNTVQEIGDFKSINELTTISNSFFGTHSIEIGMTIHFGSKE